LSSEGGLMNFLFNNKFSEARHSQKKAVTKTMRIHERSDLYKDISYQTNTVINIGRWVNRMINNNNGGEINAQ
jgi:hypothetical protein